MPSNKPVTDSTDEAETSYLESASTTGKTEKHYEVEEPSFYKIVKNSLQGFAIFDGKHMVLANQALARMIGYPVEQILNFERRHLNEIIHENDRERIKEQLDELLAGTAASHHGVYQFYHQDGHLVWLEAFATIVEYKGSTAVQIALIDVTKRVEIEAAEKEQRLWFEALAKSAAVINKTLNLQEVFANLLKHISGVIHFDFADIMLIEKGQVQIAYYFQGKLEKSHEKQLKQLTLELREIPNLWQMYQTHQSVVIEQIDDYPDWVNFEQLGPLNNLYTSYVGAPILVDNEPIGFINLNRSKKSRPFTQENAAYLQAFADQAAIAIKNSKLFTELERLNESLEEAVETATDAQRKVTQRVQTILDNSPDPILLLDKSGAIEEANPAFFNTFGVSESRIKGRPIESWANSSAPVWRQKVEITLANEQVERFETSISLPGKSEKVDVAIALSPIKTNELIGVVCLVRDVSALKEIERIKDQFVSNVSHELRSPITSVQLNLQLLLNKPHNMHQYAERIEREVKRLSDLVESLLYLSRLSQKQIVRKDTPLNINQLVKLFVHDRLPLAVSARKTLVMDLNPSLPEIFADSKQVEQVLSIFLTNALNYTPPESVITIHTERKSTGTDEWVGFAVGDTGPGIHPNEQNNLFKRFFRGQEGQRSPYPGTGLGLSIAEEIVLQHNGRIEVESSGQPGEGAIFRVWLPLTPTSPTFAPED